MPPELDSRESTRAFLEILRGRRSRRFGLGMEMPSGPMAQLIAVNGRDSPRSTQEEAPV